MDIFNIIAGIVTIISLAFAIYTYIQSRKTKEMYQQHCKTRCKDAVSFIGNLAQNIDSACEVIESQALVPEGEKTKILAHASLVGEISSALGHTKTLIRFCERLNEEHVDQFNEVIYKPDEIQEQLGRETCLLVWKDRIDIDK